MSLDAAIARWRDLEEDQFASTCTIVRDDPDQPAGTGPDGVYRRPTVDVYAGACKVKLAAREGRDVATGDTEVRLLDLVLSLPADTDVRKDDRVTIDSSPDASLVDARCRITDVLGTDWQVTRKAVLERLS